MQTYASGRPPWYTTEGVIKRPLVVGVAGGSASGKSSVCQAIINELKVQWVSVVNLDSFYKVLSDKEKLLAKENRWNFDHPDSFDMDLLITTIKNLREGKMVTVPEYDFVTHSRVVGKEKSIYGSDVIIVEGIFVLYEKRLRDLMDMKLFVDTEDDIRLARRLKRDIAERGRDVKSVLKQYETYVKPAFDDYIYPTKQYADVIIPRGLTNTVAIHLIATHMRTKLLERGWTPLPLNDSPSDSLLGDSNLHVLDNNLQLKRLETVIRDKETNRDDFIFYSDRLSRLVIEKALDLLPVQSHEVETSTGEDYIGLRTKAKVCGISIMRAGDAMQGALREVIKDVEIGSLLIQSDKKVPKLFSYSMPDELKDYIVVLMDPTIATGSTLMMALRVLLDHGVDEANIIFTTLVGSVPGLRRLRRLHPRVQIVCGAVDAHLTQEGFLSPGLGNFGDRYFGT